MEYRTLGRTELQVSEIGYGAWGIGKLGRAGAEDDESLRALHRAIDLGLNFIDTALGYGEGHSERLVGQVVRERPETDQMPKIALRFILSHPAVSTVIPGVRNVEQTMAVDGGLPEEMVRRLRAHRWVRNFYRWVSHSSRQEGNGRPSQ